MQTVSLDPAARHGGGAPTETSRAGGYGSVAIVVAKILLVLFLAGSGLIVLGYAVGPKLLPYKTYFVRSGSMRPTIPVGALGIYRPVDATELKAGDIIAFSRPGRDGDTVSHRILRVETGPLGRGFVTKGDANGSPDDWRVPAKGQGWRYSFHVAVIGYPVGLIGTPKGRFFALLAVGAVLVALALGRIWRSMPSDGSILQPTEFASRPDYASVAAEPARYPAAAAPAPWCRPGLTPLQVAPAAPRLVQLGDNGDLADYLTIISCHTSVLLRSTPESDERHFGLTAIAAAASHAAQVLGRTNADPPAVPDEPS